MTQPAQPARVGDPGAGKRTRQVVVLAAIGLLALLLREYFLLVTEITVPIKGDVRDYMAYTQNLLQYGVFSLSGPESPDAFRGPGYPLYLAAAARLAGDGWYALALHGQAVMGALTCVLVVLLGREWMGFRWAAAAGLLAALWPHHIVATASLLTEVLQGLLLLLGLWATAVALRRDSLRSAAAGGLALGAGVLVSPVLLVLAAAAVAAPLFRGQRRLAVAVLIPVLLLAGGWSLRNALVVQQDAPGRAVINFVQGSWPQYHRAAATEHRDEVSVQIMDAIQEEYLLLHADPQAGLQRMRERMADDPARYLAWYLTKPWQLWGWDIRAGMGDVYFHYPVNSPLEQHPLLSAIKQLLRLANPLLVVLAAAGLAWALARAIRQRPLSTCAAAAAMVALGLLLVTLLHALLQAEPRYAIPFRPLVLLLAATVGAWLWARLRTKPAGHL